MIRRATYGYRFATLIAVTILAFTSVATDAHASFWSDLLTVFSSPADATSTGLPSSNTPALKAANNSDPNPVKGGGDISIVGGVALMPESGPAGTMADVQEATSSTQISIYVVRKGDSLAEIATMFGVSKNTILWANNLKSASDIHPDDTLVILPVSGVQHTVLKGETVASIVKKYRGDTQDFLDFNGLSTGTKLAVGDVVIIPDGIDGPAPSASTGSKSSSSGASSNGQAGVYERLIPGYGGPSLSGYYLRPLSGGIKTQGLHGYNAVDIGIPKGTPIFAACPGTVIVSRNSGYNGGYGNYIVIQCSNGTQTVYGHLSKTLVSAGDSVDRGDNIALSGNTGRSTGAHLHFEIRGATNPF